MTDEQIDAIESAARKVRDAVGCEERIQAECDYVVASRSWRILSLIAELRQARAERDWLARALSMQCPEHRGSQVWLNIAKEAVCKN